MGPDIPGELKWDMQSDNGDTDAIRPAAPAEPEYVILVDRNDNPIGREEKVRCHMPDGKLHRAFTALLFEEQGRGLVLGRRSAEKMLWPGYWDGTFASHPRESETYVSSCQRRMPEELGAKPGRFDYLHKFEYHVPYKDIGSENEICATLVGTITDASEITQVRGEIDGIRTVTADALAQQVSDQPGMYCPWMLVALYMLERSDRAALGFHEQMLSPWISQNVRDALREAISHHMPDEAWRPVE